MSKFYNLKFKWNKLSLLKTKGAMHEVKFAGASGVNIILNTSTALRDEITEKSIVSKKKRNRPSHSKEE